MESAPQPPPTPRAGRSRKPARPSGDEGQKNLLSRLTAAEKSLRAIPSEHVDALVVLGRRGTQVVTLKGGESAYRMLVEAMSEGAATVSNDGSLLYCNRRFAQLVGRPRAYVTGTPIRSFVHDSQRERLDQFLRSARKKDAKGQFFLVSRSGRQTPVHLSLSRLTGFRGRAFGMVVTDLTEQQRRQEDEIKHTEALHRLVLERELIAQDEERRRIARELHDETGQLLTSLLVGLRSLEDSTQVNQNKKLGRRMREITAKAIDELGRLARGLHPSALDDHGLGVALKRYIDEYSSTYNIKVQLEVDGLRPQKLPPPVQIALYRIVQETLTNVARHSKAKRVRVLFKHSARCLEMSVMDDGHGFDMAAAAAQTEHHLGLQNIRERSAMLGGAATFTSGPKGTQVRVRIPLVHWAFPALGRRRRV